jgi:hypothetical protein
LGLTDVSEKARPQASLKLLFVRYRLRALDIGGVEISLKAEHPVAPLLLHAGKTAEQPAALLYGADGGVRKAIRPGKFVVEERIEGGLEGLFAPTVSALEADIDAGPVLNRPWRRQNRICICRPRF